ncbi:MAG: hypothetical protein ACI9XO_002197 [Paraglaciecola sp.]|jgi:hypothetical protein
MKKLLFLFAISSLFFVACKNDDVSSTDAAINSIPADVSSVSVINIQRLMKKADFEAVKEMAFYKKIIAEVENDGQKAIAKILQDPAASGVDLSKKAYFFSNIDPNNPENIFSGMVLNLKDASAFSALLTDAGLIVEKDANYSKTTRAQNSITAWNDEVAIIGGGSTRSTDLSSNLNQFFNTTEETSVANNNEMQKAFSNNHDFSSWFTTNPLAQNPQAGLVLSMIQVPADALKDNFINSTFDFENGQIVGHSDFLMNNDLGKNFIGKFFKEEVTTDFSDYLPAENLVFATSGAIDFKGIDQFLSERPQAKGYIDFLLKEYGLTMSDVIETFGGDLLMAGMSDGEKGNSNTLFASNVKDEKKLNTFINLAVENNILQELEDDVYKVMTVGMPGMSFSRGKGLGNMLVKNGMMFISSDEALLSKLKEGKLSKSERAMGDMVNLLNENTMGAYFDFEAVRGFSKDLENIHFDHLEVKMKNSGADFKMELEDKNMNSLKAIFQMVNESYLDSQKREAI